jgi:hypothetical protein
MKVYLSLFTGKMPITTPHVGMKDSWDLVSQETGKMPIPTPHVGMKDSWDLVSQET